MNSQKYWEDEAIERALQIEQGAVITTEEIIELYQGALTDIKEEIYKIRYMFGKRFGLDEQAANEYLDRELQKRNLEQLITRMMNSEDEQERQDILEYIRRDGLSIRAYSAREERFRDLGQIIRQRIRILEAAVVKKMTDALKDVYKASYYTLIDDTARHLNAGINFSLIPDKTIDEVINSKWYGKRFSERVWQNTELLAEKAQKTIVQGLISGQSEQKMADALKNAFDVSEYHASTLVRTEVNHAQSKADLKAYKDMGIEKYKYLATLDERTCERCQAHDGMVYNVSDAREGYNYPTMHPRCRCTTVMNMTLPGRSARDPISGKSYQIDYDVTYEEWYDSLSDEQRTALDMARNKRADKWQYERYKSALGSKNVPKSFDKFQDLKYNNSEQWEDLKGFYRYKRNNPESERKHYDCFKELRQLLPKGSIHIPIKEIDISNLSFDNNHINKERNHNVSEKNAKNYIKNAKVSHTVWNGKFERYYSYDGAAYVNTVNKEIRTAYSKKDFDSTMKQVMEVLHKHGI